MDNSKKQLSIFQKDLVKLAIWTGILGICLMSIFLYLKNDIFKTTKKIEEYKRELQNRQMIVSRIQLLEKELGESDIYLTKLKSSLPNEVEAVTLESKIKETARNYNLTINFRFGTLNLGSQNEPKSYNFSLTLTGRLNDLIKWLEEINKLVFSLKMEKIEIYEINQPIVQDNKNLFQPSSSLYEVKIIGRLYLR